VHPAIVAGLRHQTRNFQAFAPLLGTGEVRKQLEFTERKRARHGLLRLILCSALEQFTEQRWFFCRQLQRFRSPYQAP
jgi:hypothetical protein